MTTLRAIVVLLVLIMSTFSFAQDEETYSYYFADTVTVVGLKDLRLPTMSAVAAKMPIPLQFTPASVGVVTRAMFDKQDGVTLSDALKNISGVNVQNGFGTHDFFLIRGFESLSGGLVLTDGAAEPEVSFYNLYNIDRVEVLKGPSAFLYGGSPLSGAVNLVRKQPIFENFAILNGSFGQWETLRSTLDVGITNPQRNLAFRLNGFWHDSENYRDRKNNETYAINPSVSWRIDERSLLTANFEFVNSDQSPESGIPLQFSVDQTGAPVLLGIPDVPRTRSYETVLDKSTQDLYRVRLDYNRAINNSLTVRNKFYFTSLDWQSTGTLMNGAFPNQFGGMSVFRTLQTLDDLQKSLGNQLELLVKAKTGDVSHNLMGGFEINRYTDDFDLNIAAVDIANGINFDLIMPLGDRQTTPDDPVQSLDQLLQTPFAVGDASSTVIAPYLVENARFSEMVQLFVGGRFDFISYDDDRVDLDQATGQVVGSRNDRNFEKFSPMGGLVITPISEVSIYANGGKAFKPPSSLVVGEDIDPEESTQFEVGAKLSVLDGRLNSAVAFYHLKKENLGIPDQNGFTQQIGDQRSRGIEFEISAQPVRGWHAFFNYAYTDAELLRFSEFDEVTRRLEVRDGNRPAFAPEHLLNFWTAREFDFGVGLGAGLRYVSSQFIAEDNAFEIDSYVTFDAMLSYRFRNLRFSLNLKNLTDVDYETRGFSSFSVTPANPRAIFSSVDVTL